MHSFYFYSFHKATIGNYDITRKQHLQPKNPTASLALALIVPNQSYASLMAY